MLTPSLEDYLEEACRLRAAVAVIRCKDLAASLGVSLPSVTKAVKRLSRAGYAIYRTYGEITLTEKGAVEGEYLIRRNQVIRDFLGVIGSRGDVAAEAEAMEHYLSPETITALERLTALLLCRPFPDETRFRDLARLGNRPLAPPGPETDDSQGEKDHPRHPVEDRG